jgi:thymidylate synthase (FAD)
MTPKTLNVLDKGYVSIIDFMGNDATVANSARVSYDKRSFLREDGSLSEKDAKLTSFLYREGHLSTFRHNVLSFEVYAPLMVARQWYKYAVASTHLESQHGWNESSRRYITEEPVFYIPERWLSAPENSKQGSGLPLDSKESMDMLEALEFHYSQSELLYNKAIEIGVAPEQARLFLPAYGMYVRWIWTASLQTVSHFLNQRLAEDAQSEITKYAEAVLNLSKEVFPGLISLMVDNDSFK